MDDADLTQQRIEAEMEALLRAARGSAVRLMPTGACLYCGDRVDEPRPFCSVECRDDWERERRIRGITGRPEG